MKRSWLIWTLRLIAAAIMLQTLYFKFTAAPESVYIFSSLGLEPVGRIGIGCLELLASVLLLIPRTTVYGAVLGCGLMIGAVGAHLTQLGIIVQDDDGLLFMLAITVLICCTALLFAFRRDIRSILNGILK